MKSDVLPRACPPRGPSSERTRHPPGRIALGRHPLLRPARIHPPHCVAALARHTRAPWELIAVDNGSTDGTAAYLAGVRHAAPFRVEVVANLENRGFPAACNQGLLEDRDGRNREKQRGT